MNFDDCCCEQSELKIGLVLICGPPGIGKTKLKTEFSQFLANRFEQNKEIYLKKYSNYLKSNDQLRCLSISYDDLIDKSLEIDLIINENKFSETNGNDWKRARLVIRNLISGLVRYLKAIHRNNAELNSDLDIEKFIQSDATDDRQWIHFNKIRENFINSIKAQLNWQTIWTRGIGGSCVYFILLDDIFYYESMRLSYYRLASETRTNYFVYSLRSESLEFLLNRNRTRPLNERLDESIIRNIFNKFEFPNLIEWEKEFSHVELVIDANQQPDIEHLLKLSLESFNKFESHLIRTERETRLAEETRQADYETNRKNVIHVADLVLRKLISSHLSKCSNKEEKSLMSKKLIENKLNILNQLKSVRSAAAADSNIANNNSNTKIDLFSKLNLFIGLDNYLELFENELKLCLFI